MLVIALKLGYVRQVDGYLVLLIQEKALLISKGRSITLLLSFKIFLNAKKLDFALTDVLILVENRLFLQKTSPKFYGKSCQISTEIDKSFSELFSFQCFMNDYSSPPHSMCDMQKVSFL